jgi:ketosteroid isomerase-like protein
MSQENVDAVRRVYDALNEGDWEAALRDVHADFEVTLQRGPGAATHRRDGAEEWIREYIAAFDSMVFEPEEFFDSGDQVVVLLTRRAQPKGGSGEMVVRNGHIWTLRDGKLRSMRSFPDPTTPSKPPGCGSRRGGRSGFGNGLETADAAGRSRSQLHGRESCSHGHKRR